MKMIIFSTAYFPYIGGAEVAIKEITERLPKYDFDLITARMDRALSRIERIGNVTVHRVGVGNVILDKLLLPMLGLFCALRLSRAKGCNATWAMMASHGGVAAALFRSVKKIPLILTLQEGDEESHIARHPFGLALHHFVIRRADAVTAISVYLEKRAEHAGAIGRVEVIPNGVDTLKFKAQMLNDKGNPKSKGPKMIMISASRLVKKNGIEDILDALPNLPDVEFWCLGDGEESFKLQARSSKRGVADRVKWLGRYDNDELPKYLARADIFIRPSLSEGQGISFLEAMAAGVPIIGTPVGGIPDFLVDGETGVLCAPHDPESIARAVRRLMDDPALRARVMENARRLVEERYEWGPIAARYGDAFARARVTPRVLLVAPLYPPAVGGPATHAKKFFEEFPRRGLRVALVAGLGSRPFFLAHVLSRALSADLLYANDVTASGVSALVARRLFGVPYVVRVGGDILWEREAEAGRTTLPMTDFYAHKEHAGLFLYRVGRAVLAGATRVIVTAPSLAEIYLNYYGVPKEKIVVVPNPIPEVRLLKPPKSDLEGEVGFRKRGKIILFAGRFVKYKNLDVLIEAFINVYEQIKPARLVLIGDGPERANLAARAALHPAVRVERRLPHEELLRFIDHTSLCVLPATTEFNPNLALECASRGVPFLVSRGNGLAFPVTDDFLITPRDQKDLERKILAALTGEPKEPPRFPPWSWDDVLEANIRVIKEACAF